MILEVVRKSPPTKKSLHSGEAQVVVLKPGQLSPMDKGGKYLYVRQKEDLFRVELERVEWEP